MASNKLHLDSDALQRLSTFFSKSKGGAREQLSPRFVDKYLHKFQKKHTSFSHKLEYRLQRLSTVLNCADFSGLRVFDAGTGFGINALMFALAGAEKVVAVDILPGRIQDLTRLSEIAGLEERVIPICGDYADVMQKYGPYDLIIGTCFLSHINSHQDFYLLCHNQLQKEGRLYIMDDNNALSPVRQITVRKEWWSAEFSGDLKRSKGYFLRQRRKVVDGSLPSLPKSLRWFIREWCAWATRGMTIPEIEAYCLWLLDRQNPHPPKPPCAYRDPNNGVPEERLLNPLRMAKELRAIGFDVNLFPATSQVESKGCKLRSELIQRAMDRNFEIVAIRQD